MQTQNTPRTRNARSIPSVLVGIACGPILLGGCGAAVQPVDPDEQPWVLDDEASPSATDAADEGDRSSGGSDVLVFTRTEGFRHGSIEAGVVCFEEIITSLGRGVVHTEDPAVFTEPGLDGFAAIVFLNTTGDVLDAEHEVAMEQFVRRGGGFMGVHSAADTEYGWDWYAGLVGAQFQSHPEIQQARVVVDDPGHPSTRFLPQEWIRTDEWYDYRSVPDPGVRRLLLLDESSYRGGGMTDRFGEHPIAWCHEYDGGRSFYTGGGHTDEAFDEQEFVRHLTGGLRWVLGEE